MSNLESTFSDSTSDLSELYTDKPFETYETISYEKSDSIILEIQKDSNWNSILTSIQHSITNYDKLKHKPYNDYPYFKLSEGFKYKPPLIIPNGGIMSFVSEEQWKQLHGVLPYYHQYKNISLLYKMTIDGSLLRTFYEKAKCNSCTIFIVKDLNGNVFGAFSSEVLHYNEENNGKEFFGTGESFLFSFYKSKHIRIFHSTGENDNYIYCNKDMIAFGCSNGEFGLCLKDNFTEGYTGKCDTYNNMEISEEKFVIVDIELWGL